MAVGGLHRKDKDHGRSTTSMGVAMVQYANTVLTPAGEKIEVSSAKKSSLLNCITDLVFDM